MHRAVARNISLVLRHHLSQSLPPQYLPLSSVLLHQRLLSDDSSTLSPHPTPASAPASDVSNKELKQRLEKYFSVDEEIELPSVAEAVLERKITGGHDDTDDELIDELHDKPLHRVGDREFESDFEDLCSTDEEIPDLYNAREYVENKLMSNKFFNMSDTKWNEMIQKATEQGLLKDTKDCEDLLEDMLKWDKLLPDHIKEKLDAKLEELGEMCEKGELEPEKGSVLFQEFEDKIVHEYLQEMEAKEAEAPEEKEVVDSKKGESDDPPGEGPILRWESRVVFAPGGDAWHPKNRKVKLSVTVKELGLSRHAYRRLREVVGKRYHSGRDELTITSERFEHREENRKDCLRTLYALIADAMKADKLVEDARVSHVKNKLRTDHQFMERLKTAGKSKSLSVSS